MSEIPRANGDKEPDGIVVPLFGEASSEPKELSLFHPSIVRLVKREGRYFTRKPRPVTDFREPTTPEIVQTVIDGTVEASRRAIPGKHVIVTGIKDEQYVLSKERFAELSSIDENGAAIPHERRVLALPNPYHVPIVIEAPWSTPEDPHKMVGGADAVLVFSLNDELEMTEDRYLVQTEELFNETYSPVQPWGQDS